MSLSKIGTALGAALWLAVSSIAGAGCGLQQEPSSPEQQPQQEQQQEEQDQGLVSARPSAQALTARPDFREDTIYFVITSRFYDGDPTNNVHCWDDAQAGNPDSDPCYRGDFEGLIQKLDYIKALGFSAIWITPVVKNASGYDYHGYHAINHREIDPRLRSKARGETALQSYQRLINAAHAKGLKIVQDVVVNHSGNFGEENLFPMFTRNTPAGLNETIAQALTKLPNPWLPSNYDTLTASAQYAARIAAMKEDAKDTEFMYHHEKSLSWESYTVQTGQIAGDCVDHNTENPVVYQYLADAYNQYIDMGVDAFRVDTVKHVSRLSFNKGLIPAWKARGGSNFFIFGEVASRYRQVWNSGIPAISCPFYTWKESVSYPWGARTTNEASVYQNWSDNSTTAGQPTSNNHLLNGNAYHAPDWSRRSGLDIIDFPMHWNFQYARDAFSVALSGDQFYNDATWNVTYVDSHDYAPDGAPENQRFAQPRDTWAENLDLMFTFRGIPTLFYGSEIEFQKGKPIDVGPNAPLSTTGRAYYGDHITGSVTASDFGAYSGASGNVATTLSHPLAQHVRRLNLIRRAVPALQKGQYSTDGCNGSMAFKRRYTNGTDSFALVTISGDATFTGIPNGTYKDAITGAVANVTSGTLTTSGAGAKGNMRVYVLNGPGKIGEDTQWLFGSGSTVTPPAAPTGVGATPASGQVTVSWTASSGATSYTVYRSTSASSGFASVGTTSGTSYTSTGLAGSTTYYFYVTASNAGGASGASSTVSATTPAGGTTTTTTLRVHYDVGLGNTMYVRGSLSPLSWTTGAAATWTTGNVWVYTTTAIPAGATFEWKALVNDSGWSDGANFTGSGGQTLDVTPTFNGNFYDVMDTISTNWAVTGGTTTARWVQGTLSGSGVAKCTNCSTESVLTLKNALNKTGTAVTLGFKYSTSGLLSTEYLAVDVLKGTTWTKVGSYYGTRAATNVSLNITSYGSTALKLRFRAKMSGSTKYVTVDNVTVSVRK